VAGKQVFTELSEIVDPSHTALLIVDMQRDFCCAGGSFDRLGVDLSMYPPVIDRIGGLLEGARQSGVLPVFVQMTVLPNRASESPAQIRFNLRLHDGHHGQAEPLAYAVDGSEGQNFVPGLEPQEGELVVKKYRSSAFWGTNLALLLRSNGIKSVVVSGCTTEGCVESTARDAMFSDYYVVLATDAVASDDKKQHDASMYLMAHRFDLATSEDIRKHWPARNR
ncbi:MAG: isochorismatase family cysteine hydrolase, partial [Streptosporangiaceae bacterium]